MSSKSRANFALKWSIEALLARATRPCGFYLVTCARWMDWPEFSKRHARMLRLMNVAARERRLPRHGGVRVFEEGDQTHRAHAHWVMSPRMSQKTVQHYATLAGLGHVWLDFRPAGGPLAGYLCKYLSKGKPSMQGLKQWACFGEFSGVKVKDVEIDSEDVRQFREHRKVGLAQGMSTTQAFTYASVRVNMAKYGVFADTEQGTPPRASAKPSPDEKTEVTAVWNVVDKPGQVCIVKHDDNA